VHKTRERELVRLRRSTRYVCVCALARACMRVRACVTLNAVVRAAFEGTLWCAAVRACVRTRVRAMRVRGRRAVPALGLEVHRQHNAAAGRRRRRRRRRRRAGWSFRLPGGDNGDVVREDAPCAAVVIEPARTAAGCASIVLRKVRRLEKGLGCMKKLFSGITKNRQLWDEDSKVEGPRQLKGNCATIYLYDLQCGSFVITTCWK
jgi:hypothetical protein